MSGVVDFVEFGNGKPKRLLINAITLELFLVNADKERMSSFDMSKLTESELREWVIFWQKVFKSKFGEL